MKEYAQDKGLILNRLIRIGFHKTKHWVGIFTFLKTKYVTVCKFSQASCLLLQENASFLVVLMMMIILDDFWVQKNASVSIFYVSLQPRLGFISAKLVTVHDCLKRKNGRITMSQKVNEISLSFTSEN